MKIIGKPRKQGENASSKDEKIIAEAGKILSDDGLEQVAGGWGREVSPIFGDVTTCELCGNSERGTVYPLQDPMSGLRIIEYYCEHCQQSFGVYVG